MTEVIRGIAPEPSDDEAAAIVAAMYSLVSGGPEGGPQHEPMSRWRFSGRWWSRPVPSRRVRP